MGFSAVNKTGIKGSPPRKYVTKFVARLVYSEQPLFQPQTLVTYTPPGGHPWFIYPPEMVV
jgi:hypothetical protein